VFVTRFGSIVEQSIRCGYGRGYDGMIAINHLLELADDFQGNSFKGGEASLE
jgi:hypothetical protein